MTSPPLSSANLDERRRRALFRSRHRGMREMDLLLGGFADAHLSTMGEAELADFERLLDAPDDLVFAWIMGLAEAPTAYDTPLFRRLSAFHSHTGPLHV